MMTTDIDCFLVWLRAPAKLYGFRDNAFSQDWLGSIAGEDLIYTYPAGLAFPDILFDSQSRAFIGLSFHVANRTALYERTCALLDRSMVNYNDLKEPSARSMYPGLHGEGPSPRLEVKWAQSQSPSFKSAQLDSVRFYISRNWNTIGTHFPIAALEVDDVQYILREWALVAPTGIEAVL